MEGKIGNTINSHRLAQLGYNEGGFELQNKIIEGIFSGYYEKGQDVSSIDFLVSVAESVGLDGDKVRTFLNGSE
jgi:predicted DsbA family dithiol-disulfide isomerase